MQLILQRLVNFAVVTYAFPREMVLLLEHRSDLLPFFLSLGCVSPLLIAFLHYNFQSVTNSLHLHPYRH
jgi:hypothetical protein